MSSPCNSLNVVPIKVSQLVKYSNIDLTDFILTVESGSALYSRKSTFGDVIHSLSHYTSSFSGSFTGSFNGKSSGSFSGSHYGLLISKTAKITGSFDGMLRSQDAKLSGSFSGSIYGKVVSKNVKITGSFLGQLRSQDSKLSGSFSGSTYGKLFSKNAKITGSLRGSGSFFGLNYINNFKGTGKKVSFNGTASYAVSSSHAETSTTSGINQSGLGGLNSSVFFSSLSPQSVQYYYTDGAASGTYNWETNHTFTSTPALVSATFICTSTNAGYAAGDEISIDSVIGNRGNGQTPFAALYKNTTKIGVSLISSISGYTTYTIHKTSGGVYQSFNANNWKIMLRAWK